MSQTSMDTESPRPARQLSAVRMEIAFHQQELLRLQSLVESYDGLLSSDSDSPTSPTPDRAPHLPLSSTLACSPGSSSRVRFLEEAWAKKVSQETTSALPWMRDWAFPFARPPVLAGDFHRASVAASISAAAVPAEELLTQLCQLARVIFGVKWAAVAIVEENFVHLRASDTVHPPMIGKRSVPRLISLCNWVIAKVRPSPLLHPSRHHIAPLAASRGLPSTFPPCVHCAA